MGGGLLLHTRQWLGARMALHHGPCLAPVLLTTPLLPRGYVAPTTASWRLPTVAVSWRLTVAVLLSAYAVRRDAGGEPGSDTARGQRLTDAGRPAA